jgi:hypothetical protein
MGLKKKQGERIYLLYSLETKRKKINRWIIRIMNHYKIKLPKSYEDTIFTKQSNQYNLQIFQNHMLTNTMMMNGQKTLKNTIKSEKTKFGENTSH